MVCYRNRAKKIKDQCSRFCSFNREYVFLLLGQQIELTISRKYKL